GAAHDREAERGVVTIRDPAIEARVTASSPLSLGGEVTVRLVGADLATRKVAFELDAQTRGQ
ncbi:MAG: hypothetical protein ACRCYU_22170, partial [Nocardioides sp.]